MQAEENQGAYNTLTEEPRDWSAFSPERFELEEIKAQQSGMGYEFTSE